MNASSHLVAAVGVSAFLIGIPLGWLAMKRYYLWRHRRR